MSGSSSWRSGYARAIELTSKAISVADSFVCPRPWKIAEWFELVAAAYAETGHLDAAVRRQTRALHEAKRRPKLQLQSRLELYKNGKPCRES